jgi:uncharacterized membrane protein
MLHLIHPALVHFSVAFVVVGGVGEVWGLLARRETLRRWGASLVLVGLASLVFALASGYLAANTLEVDAASVELLDAHERTGWILLAVLFVTQFWKAWCGGKVPERLRWIYIAALSASVLLAAYGAWLGGRLVYLHALGVA